MPELKDDRFHDDKQIAESAIRRYQAAGALGLNLKRYEGHFSEHSRLANLQRFEIAYRRMGDDVKQYGFKPLDSNAGNDNKKLIDVSRQPILLLPRAVNSISKKFKTFKISGKYDFRNIYSFISGLPHVAHATALSLIHEKTTNLVWLIWIDKGYDAKKEKGQAKIIVRCLDVNSKELSELVSLASRFSAVANGYTGINEQDAKKDYNTFKRKLNALPEPARTPIKASIQKVGNCSIANTNVTYHLFLAAKYMAAHNVGFYDAFERTTALYKQLRNYDRASQFYAFLATSTLPLDEPGYDAKSYQVTETHKLSAFETFVAMMKMVAKHNKLSETKPEYDKTSALDLILEGLSRFDKQRLRQVLDIVNKAGLEAFKLWYAQVAVERECDKAVSRLFESVNKQFGPALDNTKQPLRVDKSLLVEICQAIDNLRDANIKKTRFIKEQDVQDLLKRLRWPSKPSILSKQETRLKIAQEKVQIINNLLQSSDEFILVAKQVNQLLAYAKATRSANSVLMPALAKVNALTIRVLHAHRDQFKRAWYDRMQILKQMQKDLEEASNPSANDKNSSDNDKLNRLEKRRSFLRGLLGRRNYYLKQIAAAEQDRTQYVQQYNAELTAMVTDSDIITMQRKLDEKTGHKKAIHRMFDHVEANLASKNCKLNNIGKQLSKIKSTLLKFDPNKIKQMLRSTSAEINNQTKKIASFSKHSRKATPQLKTLQSKKLMIVEMIGDLRKKYTDDTTTELLTKLSQYLNDHERTQRINNGIEYGNIFHFGYKLSDKLDFIIGLLDQIQVVGIDRNLMDFLDGYKTCCFSFCGTIYNNGEMGRLFGRELQNTAKELKQKPASDTENSSNISLRISR